MKKHTRIKDFTGLPHELDGIDYTDNSEVEGGEKSYSPMGSENEFIFRKISSNIKELEKQDKLRSKREKGDRISDISFDEVARNLMKKEATQLLDEGIDPFNEGQQSFSTGGSRGTVPVIDETAQEVTNTPSVSSSQIAGAVGSLANTASQSITTDSRYDQPLEAETGVMQATGDTIAGAAGVPFYQETKAVSNLGDTLSDVGMEKDNQALTRTGDFIEGIDTFGTRMKSIDAADKGIITEGENVGIQALSFLGGPWGQMFLGEKEKQFADMQEKQAGYDSILNERGFHEYNLDGDRNRIGFGNYKNGGVKRKTYRTGGLIEPKGYQEGDDIPNIFGSIRKEDLGSLNFAQPSGNPNSPDIRTSFPELTIKASDYPDPIDPDEPFEFATSNPITEADYKAIENIYQNLYNQPSSSAGSKKSNTSTNTNNEKRGRNTLATIGALGQMAPAIAYLLGEGKDYDKVDYPEYNPELLKADLPLREVRDAFGSGREALRQQGKLDLGALALLGSEEAEGRSKVRENIANLNTSILNDAQLKNIATTIRQMDDEARNKGQHITNKYAAYKDIAGAGAGAIRQHGMMSNDELVEAKFTELFG